MLGKVLEHDSLAAHTVSRDGENRSGTTTAAAAADGRRLFEYLHCGGVGVA
jgi:hypothetical protein